MSYLEWSRDVTSRQRTFMKLLDFLINRLPFVSKINGKKRQIAGVAVAIAAVLYQASPLLPEPYATAVLGAAESIKHIAEVFGVWGVAGMVVKKEE